MSLSEPPKVRVVCEDGVAHKARIFVGPFPEPVTKVQVGDKWYPVKDFKLELKPGGAPYTGVDFAEGPDATILSTWQRDKLMGSIKLRPYLCNWSRMLVGMGTENVPFTRAELRAMRKQIRDKKGKMLLKQIARNPLLSEQDPRKLKRLARRKAQQMKGNHTKTFIVDDPC